MAERNDLTIDLMLIDVVMPDLSGPDLGSGFWPSAHIRRCCSCPASRTTK
jgi:hypothetical protein